MSGFSLLAIPFFILAGAIMAVGGMAERLVNLAKVFVGFIRGGMALVNILASTHVRLHLGLLGRRYRRGRLGDDPADDQERLSAPVRRQRDDLGLAAAAARPALAQHDHLFDRGGRHDLGRAPVHGRHHSGPAARPLAHHPGADHRVPRTIIQKGEVGPAAPGAQDRARRDLGHGHDRRSSSAASCRGVFTPTESGAVAVRLRVLRHHVRLPRLQVERAAEADRVAWCAPSAWS